MKIPRTVPLKNIRSGKISRLEQGRDWFRFTLSGKFSADIILPDDAFPCRLGCPRFNQVVQLSSGDVESNLADALFSPSLDKAVRFTGEGVRLRKSGTGHAVTARGTFTLHLVDDLYRKRLGITHFAPLDRSVFKRAPSGWCSWYIYYHDVTEKGVLRNLAWLEKNLVPYGLEYLQIDDGWQGDAPWKHGLRRNWFTWDKARFPHGMKWVADKIRDAGMIPGIWVIPFGFSMKDRFKKTPGAFLRRTDGTSVGEIDTPEHTWVAFKERYYDWIGRYIADATSPGATKLFTELFDFICKEWGYDYVKIDAQSFVSGLYKKYQSRFHDPSVSPVEAYRRGLKVMKKAMGKKRFLLNCLSGWDSAGICEGIRMGGDVSANLEGLLIAVDSTLQKLHLNNIAWYTDPDVVCVRPPLTLEQARMWATLMGLTGQLLMTSDDMPGLPADRVELLKRILPVADIRPMELYTLTERSGILNVKVDKPGAGKWDVVGIFNYQAQCVQRHTLTPAMFGNGECKEGYVYFDFWKRKVLGTGVQSVDVTVPAHSCAVIGIRKKENRPQLIATTRHIMQGLTDLESVTWDAKKNELRGRSCVVGDDPYEIWFTVPQGWRMRDKESCVKNGVGVMVIREKTNTTVDWKIGFHR